MGIPERGAIVLVRFPFSDLSESKLRPALVLVQVGRGDVVLCQITSQPYADVSAIAIESKDLKNGTLRRISYIRPTKLFTANQSIIARTIAELAPVKFEEVIEVVVSIFRS